MRLRGFESRPVLLVFDNRKLDQIRAHDVAAAYRFAMAEVRVRLPLGALYFESQDVGKSGIPRAPGARDRWFKSSRPDN